MAKKFDSESCELIAPVTALEFVNTKLFVGEGPYLSVYEITNAKRVAIQRTFRSQRIHCIKVCVVSNPTTIVVCGGKAASVLYLQECSDISTLSLVRTTLFIDWIWDLCLLYTPQKRTLQVGLATGHNAVWLWDLDKDEKHEVAQCEEQCILYCARFIGRTLETLWLACGTVFNEVLLWEVTSKKNDGGKVCVSKRLRGHGGVIFSIRYDEDRQILCSVSDDRSIRVWRLYCCLKDCVSKQETVEPLLVLYGHKARVWDCLILHNYIVSIGEDSSCLVWNSKGEIIKKFKGHIGKSIWSLAASQDKQIIATGGGDGSVRLWSLNEEEEDTQEQHTFSAIPQLDGTLQPCRDIPRSLGFLPDDSVLVMTDKGNFYKYSWLLDGDKSSTTQIWNFWRNEPKFCSYSVMALSPCRTIIALGNIHGNVKLQSTIDPSWCPLELKPYEEKVLSLHWLKDDEVDKPLNLFSCGPDGLILWWSVSCSDVNRVFLSEVKAYFRLPYCRQRWPNSIFLSPKGGMSTKVLHEPDSNARLVLCGDRRGSLHIFKAGDKGEPLDPLHSHIGIHGRNGVTHISSYREFVYTAGRDGYFRQYQFRGTNLELMAKRKVYKGLEWIEQLKFTSDGDLLVLGFHKVDFVIWSTRRNEILLRIPCGGGHRVWDFHCSESEVEKTTIFTYLKKMAVHVHKICEKEIQYASILQESFHGREATCVCFIGSIKSGNEGTSFHLLATGSEDTVINIMAYNPKGMQGKFSKFSSIQGHISSVRCLTLIRVNDVHVSEGTAQNFLLFSGGGRASLKCWSLNLASITWNEPKHIPYKSDGSSYPTCTLLAELPNQFSRYRRKRVYRQVIEGSFCDTRFMSVSVFWFSDLTELDRFKLKNTYSIYGVITGCSDGSLRFYVLDTQIKNFQLIGQCSWNDKCVLCVGHFIQSSSTEPRLVVYTADTAGRIAFWDFTELFSEYFSKAVRHKDGESDLVSDEHLHSESENLDAGLAGLSFEGTKVYMGGDTDSSDIGTSQDSDRSEGHFNKNVQNNSTEKPFYIHNSHQSGINDISLVLQENDKYLMCTGGDDGALAVALFEVRETKKSLDVHTCWETTVSDAHQSSLTGVKIIEDCYVLSASVDQRLKLWKINVDKHSVSVTLNESHFVDVADIQDIAVQRNGECDYLVVVCGVGLQMLTLKLNV